VLCSIPIIIYILNRRRYKRIIWAAMEFLLQAMKKNRRRLQIENLLLLIIRTAIILFLVFAIAGPMVKGGGLLEELVKPKKNWVILIDNSFSMGYKTGETTSLDRALSAAKSFVEKLEPGDRIAVCLMNSDLDTEGLFPTPVTISNKKEDTRGIVAALSDVSTSHKTTNVPNALEKVLKILDRFEPGAAQPSRSKTLFLITDCQKYGWLEDDVLRSKRLTAVMEGLQKRNTELKIIDVGEDESPNFAVTSLVADALLVGTEVPVRFEAEIRNFGAKDFGDIVASLIVDDVTQQSVTVSVPPGESKKVFFTHEFRDRGYHWVQVASRTDPLGIDNNRFLALKVRDKVSILIVDGQPLPEPWRSETSFLEAVFRVGSASLTGERLSVVEPRSVTQADLEQMTKDASRGRLEDFDVVFLANVSDFSPDTASEIESYVRNGGSLFIFLGEMVVPERYNELLFRDGQGFLPAKLLELAGDKEKMTPLRLEVLDFSHPIFRFFEPENYRKLLTPVKTYVYYKTEVPQGKKDTEILAVYNDSDRSPAVIEKSYGRGRTVLVTTTSSMEWNAWATRPFFLCFLNEAVSYLSRGSEAGLNILVGEPYQKVVPSEEFAQEVHIVVPTGETVRKTLSPLGAVPSESQKKEPEEKQQEFLLTHSETDKSGIYKVIFAQETVPGSAPERTECFSVNVDTRESDMEKIVQRDLREAFPNVKPEITQYKEVKEKLAKGKTDTGAREMWWYVVLAVLTLLFVESLLALRFGKYER
jgi:hypothetical protein